MPESLVVLKVSSVDLKAVDEAGVLDDLAKIWDQAKAVKLVGSEAAASPRATLFLTHWKARATALAAAAKEPDGDGVVDAEIVTDGSPAADKEAAIWQQILTVAGDLGMQLPALQADFKTRMGIIPDEASAVELAKYLDLLAERGAA